MPARANPIRLALAALSVAVIAGCGESATPSSVFSTGNATVSASQTQASAVADCAMIVKESFTTRNELSAGALSSSAKLMLRFVQFSDEVLNNMIARVNECQKSFPSEFMIVTGDSADLTTIAETRRFIDNLDGTFDQMSAFEENCRKQFPAGTPEPFLEFSCTRFTGRGVADTQAADIAMDNPALRTAFTRSVLQLQNTSQAVLSGRNEKGETDPSRQTFNRAAGLPEVLRCKEGSAACISESLKMPWMVAFGNHDGYLRGTAASGTGVNEASMATGRRHIDTQQDFIAEFFKSSSQPKGHGFNFADTARKADNNPNNDGYYAFDAGQNKFRMIVLNTIIDGRDARLPTDKVRNPAALADGTIDKIQFEWLKKELASAYEKKQLVMVFSHHADLTFAEYGSFAQLVQIDVTAAQLDAELASYPNMIAWVAGHTHRHRVRAFAVDTKGIGDNGSIKAMVTCKKKDACKGFWQIESASLIDFPQEQRLIEVLDNGDGTGVLRSPVIGHNFEKSKKLAQYDDRCQFYFTDPASYQSVKSTEADLAGLCVFGGTRQGDKKDRNVNLMFAMPF